MPAAFSVKAVHLEGPLGGMLEGLAACHGDWRPHRDSVPLAMFEEHRRKPEDRCGTAKFRESEFGVPTATRPTVSGGPLAA
jgi:hypothetical protein